MCTYIHTHILTLARISPVPASKDWRLEVTEPTEIKSQDFQGPQRCSLPSLTNDLYLLIEESQTGKWCSPPAFIGSGGQATSLGEHLLAFPHYLTTFGLT